MRKTLFPFLFLLAAAYLTGCRASDEVQAPELKFTAVDGRKVDLAAMRDKVVLVDFWATWCPPCKKEVPSVVAAYNKYHAKGFDIIGVSFDQDKDALLSFTKENGMVWPQYFDGKGWDNDINDKLGITMIPTMWLVDRKGLMTELYPGDDIGAAVEKLLK